MAAQGELGAVDTSQTLVVLSTKKHPKALGSFHLWPMAYDRCLHDNIGKYMFFNSSMILSHIESMLVKVGTEIHV